MDTEFKFDFVPQTQADRIQRSAVLYALYPCDGSASEVMRRTDSLIRLRRAALQKLWRASEARWGAAEKPYSAQLTLAQQYARNCCPAFVRTLPLRASCRQTWLCPFCYARWVRDVWCRFVAVVPGQGLAPYDLLERRYQIRLPFLPTDEYQRLAANARSPKRRHKIKAAELAADGEAIAAYLQQSLYQATASRGDWVNQFEPAGAFTNTVVTPSDACWQISHRQLLLLPAGRGLTPEQALRLRGRWTLHECPTHAELYRAVVRVCRYPAALLRGNPELLALLQRAREGCRLTATCGVLRRRHVEATNGQ